jgi:NAD(P)-dependent dehydrogenase (short-subunit alcohol dehydrogenase family)/acyl carrier protein
MDFDTKGRDLPIVQRDTLSLSRGGCYLITGGFGGFGRKTAEWLVAHGVRSLVLTGRTGADNADRQAFVESLRQQGVQVLAAACDTSDLGQLEQLFREIATEMPPLTGVIHSAALIQDQPIAELDDATIANVLRSKALGAWNLHLLTQSMALEHFVLYSSIANLVGNSRQSAYSAANGFLNGLAELRRLQGLPATSVAWGAIADVGVVAQDDKLEQFLRYTGLRGIESSEGLEVMAIALARKISQLGITMITSWADWARFETRGSKSPRFATLIAGDSEEKDSSIRDALIRELNMLDDSERIEVLGGLLIEVIASVVKSDPQSIALDCPINQLGVDSLMATEIQLLLDTKLGLSISVLELIGETTIRGLATQSLKTLMGDATTQSLKVATS